MYMDVRTISREYIKRAGPGHPVVIWLTVLVIS